MILPHNHLGYVSIRSTTHALNIQRGNVPSAVTSRAVAYLTNSVRQQCNAEK